ncbi:MAG: hypothetical protein NT106_10150 [Candidatus Sumerlaeota bacterium]|nr:hypothetical protein [Candidatus Sumerlaeota bacterium]
MKNMTMFIILLLVQYGGLILWSKETDLTDQNTTETLQKLEDDLKLTDNILGLINGKKNYIGKYYEYQFKKVEILFELGRETEAIRNFQCVMSEIIKENNLMFFDRISGISTVFYFASISNAYPEMANSLPSTDNMDYEKKVFIQQLKEDLLLFKDANKKAANGTFPVLYLFYTQTIHLCQMADSQKYIKDALGCFQSYWDTIKTGDKNFNLSDEYKKNRIRFIEGIFRKKGLSAEFTELLKKNNITLLK